MGVTDWTMDEAVRLIRVLEPMAAKRGFHIGLCGGVLQKGRSEKDVDLLLYPDCTAIPGDYAGLKKDWASLGIAMTHSAAQMKALWVKQGVRDGKHVEVFRLKDGRRIDLIFVGK